jgi:hypothetical protein
MTATSESGRGCRGCRAHRQSGAVLAIGLVLLLILTVLATAGMQAATVELQLAGNAQHQQRAFRAAEAGIEQAIAAGVFTIDPAATADRYDDLTVSEPRPIPGAGTPIDACTSPLTDTGGRCEYFLRFDHATGVTPVPGTDPNDGTGLGAYHFVVDAVGIAARGARAEQTQGFYLVGPAALVAACQANRDDCVLDVTGPPVRTYWRQRGTD